MEYRETERCGENETETQEQRLKRKHRDKKDEEKETENQRDKDRQSNDTAERQTEQQSDRETDRHLGLNKEVCYIRQAGSESVQLLALLCVCERVRESERGTLALLMCQSIKLPNILKNVSMAVTLNQNQRNRFHLAQN